MLRMWRKVCHKLTPPHLEWPQGNQCSLTTFFEFLWLFYNGNLSNFAFENTSWEGFQLTNGLDKETRAWDLRTYQYWTSLLQGNEGPVCGIPGSEGRGEDDLRSMAFARTKAVGLAFKESRNYWGKVRYFIIGHYFLVDFSCYTQITGSSDLYLCMCF